MRNRKEIEQSIQSSSFDWLGRDTFIENFCQYILKQDKSTHVCINGVWGSGKTTTVLGIIQKLNVLEEVQRPLIIYLDAWKYEHYDHPLFSLLKVMEETAPNIVKQIMSDFNSMQVTPQLGVNLPLFGLNLSVGKGESNQKKVLNLSEYVDVLNDLLIKAINKFKEEKGNNLIIFVDELDRAKPDFALRTIEVFHHLQDELPTHFVYSVDMNQLNGMIKHYYGYDYNVEIFVHKVFDVIIPLQKVTKFQYERYAESIFEQLGTKYSVGSIKYFMFQYMSLNQIESLRTIEKLSKKIHEDLSQGYFSADYRRSQYYLGKENSNHIWGYVELLIVLNIMNLSNPILVKEIVRGSNLQKLADYLERYKNRINEQDLWNLIRSSFNYGRPESEQMDDKAIIETSMILTGLEKIFIPPQGYGNQPVFDFL